MLNSFVSYDFFFFLIDEVNIFFSFLSQTDCLNHDASDFWSKSIDGLFIAICSWGDSVLYFS